MTFFRPIKKLFVGKPRGPPYFSPSTLHYVVVHVPSVGGESLSTEDYRELVNN